MRERQRFTISTLLSFPDAGRVRLFPRKNEGSDPIFTGKAFFDTPRTSIVIYGGRTMYWKFEARLGKLIDEAEPRFSVKGCRKVFTVASLAARAAEGEYE